MSNTAVLLTLSRRRLTLILAVLGRETKQSDNAQSFEFGKVIAERTGLRRTSARTRNGIPSIRGRFTWYARPRINVNDRSAFEGGQIDLRTIGRRKQNGSQPEPREVPRTAVIFRYR